MLRRNLAAVAFAAVAGLLPFWNGPAKAQGGGGQPVELQFWHGLAQPLGGQLEGVVAAFNESQNRYRIVPTFRGSYPETMVAAIAAFRANSAPHLVQMFEVGTGTMMAAGRDAFGRTALQLGEDSRVLVIGTEGATDPALHAKLVGAAAPGG